ncbi:MAG TPA: carboxymuconolactone decarboxylase family protein [bacterium]|nr:carboxymuconolactone decarboxylase family protein [bacterium]
MRNKTSNNNQTPQQFKEERKRLNKKVLKMAGKNTKRFFSLDNAVYRKGSLPVKTKELMGLVSSTVLRCDDCIRYHLGQCFENNVSDEELEETLSIALIVGGSITIPHIRKAVDFWFDLKESESTINE